MANLKEVLESLDKMLGTPEGERLDISLGDGKRTVIEVSTLEQDNSNEGESNETTE